MFLILHGSDHFLFFHVVLSRFSVSHSTPEKLILVRKRSVGVTHTSHMGHEA